VPASDSPSTEALGKLIDSIAQERRSPLFRPHVTLASLPDSVTIEQVAAALLLEPPVPLAFDDICTGKTFYQSVFISMRPSFEILALRQRVHEKLGIEAKTPHFPHMSLYYGDTDREAIVDKLKEEGWVQNIDGGGVIVGATSAVEAMEVWMMDCSGKPEDWNMIMRVKLDVVGLMDIDERALNG